MSARAPSGGDHPPAWSRTGAATARTRRVLAARIVRAGVADACYSSTAGTVIVHADEPAVDRAENAVRVRRVPLMQPRRTVAADAGEHLSAAGRPCSSTVCHGAVT